MAVILEIRCCNILVNVVLHLIASILNRGNRSTEPGHRQQYFIDEKCCGRSAIGCVYAMGFLSRSLASSRELISRPINWFGAIAAMTRAFFAE